MNLIFMQVDTFSSPRFYTLTLLGEAGNIACIFGWMRESYANGSACAKGSKWQKISTLQKSQFPEADKPQTEVVP